MAKHRRFSLVVEGQGVRPSTVRLSDLIAILNDVQKALVATAGGKREQHHLSLVDVENGSLNLVLEADAAIARAAKRISDAIQRRSGESLPQPAVVSVRDIQKRAAARHWSVTMANGDFKSTIHPELPVFADPLVHGATTLFGTVLAVGGVRPTAKIVLADNRHITAEVATKATAQQLATSLYGMVELHGDAWWYSSSMQLSRFRINGVGDYEHKLADPVRAFSDLKKEFGSVWDTVDPDQFVRQQREETSG